MDERDREIRGEQARRILNDEIFQEAFAALEARWVGELARQDTSDARANYLRFMLIAMRAHRGYIDQVMHSGTLAAMEIERKRTLKDRLLRRV